MRKSRRACGRMFIVLLLTPLFGLTWAPSVGRGEDPEFRVFDGFDGKLELKWEPVRPDPTHVSLAKNPGKLTITTQDGTIGFDETRPGVIPARNLYLIPNPAIDGGDFAMTTCIEAFQPTMRWQQAGLLIYDDDDNYLKCDMEYTGTAFRFKYMRETDQQRVLDTDEAVPSPEHTWIRIIKRGNVYERAYSTDGKSYVSAGEKSWGNGAPKWVGIVAKNGSGSADDVDALFDFFEVRSLTDAEKGDPRYVERKKLQGAWEVVSRQLSGKPLKMGGFSGFVFDGGSVIISEKARSLQAEYALDPSQDPKGFVLSELSPQTKIPVNGVYALDGETLTICLALGPGASAPSELETTEGDSRMLITLRRASAEKEPAEEPGE